GRWGNGPGPRAGRAFPSASGGKRSSGGARKPRRGSHWVHPGGRLTPERQPMEASFDPPAPGTSDPRPRGQGGGPPGNQGSHARYPSPASPGDDNGGGRRVWGSGRGRLRADARTRRVWGGWSPQSTGFGPAVTDPPM